MHVLEIILIIIASYFFLVFFVLRLVAPYMGFWRYKVPTNLPVEIKNEIIQLENISVNQQSYLEAAYRTVLARWKHTRHQALLHLPKLFIKDLKKIWYTKDFIYCTTMNFIVYVLLANSRYFKVQDVKVKHVFLNFVPHQYLQVKVGERWVDVDPAGAGIRGLGIGCHASFFG